jgi:hypothetical protein
MRGDVGLARSMTALTSGIGRRFLSGRYALEVGILVEPEPDIGVACLANDASDISVLRGISG